VGEDLVDPRCPGDAGDEAHRAVAGRARQRVHCNELGRLAYQPAYRLVTWPWSGRCISTRAGNSSGSAVSVPAVGPSDVSDRYVTALAARS
jgi:hypothetical protein